jgi:hypothetical protein
VAVAVLRGEAVGSLAEVAATTEVADEVVVELNIHQ